MSSQTTILGAFLFKLKNIYLLTLNFENETKNNQQTS